MIFSVAFLLLGVSCAMGDNFKGACLFGVENHKNQTAYFDFSQAKPLVLKFAYDSYEERSLYLKLCSHFHITGEIFPMEKNIVGSKCRTDDMFCLDYGDGHVQVMTLMPPYYRNLVMHGGVTEFDMVIDLSGENVEVGRPLGFLPPILSSNEKKGRIIISLSCNLNVDRYMLDYHPTPEDPDEIMFRITWKTPYACPIPDYKLRKACYFSVPGTLNTVDLTSLRHGTNYNAGNFEVNVCGAIRQGSCPGGDVVVCDTSNNVAIALIKDMDIEGGTDGFKFTTFQGHRPHVKIEIVCEYKEVVELKLVKANADEIIFELETPFACVVDNLNCMWNSFNDAGDMFHLGALKKYAGNYKIRAVNSDFFINVCGSVNPSNDMPPDCLDETCAACQVGHNGKITKYDIDSYEILYQKSGMIEFTFKGDDKCSVSHMKSELKLTLTCLSEFDKLARNRDQLVFVKYEECVTYMTMKTEHACPKKFSFGSNCALKINYPEPHALDLNPYEGRREPIEGGLRVTYQPAICLSDQPISCGSYKHASMCAKNKHGELAIGVTPYTFQYLNGRIFFETIGEPCHVGGPYSRVQIDVKCHQDIEDKITIKNENFHSCIFNYVWHVKGACKRQYDSDICYTSRHHLDADNIRVSGNLRDLPSGFQRSKSEIVVNFCSPIMDAYMTMCDHDDTSCIITREIGTNIYRHLSIGKFNKRMYSNNILTYGSETVCVENPYQNYSTEIEFKCDSTPRMHAKLQFIYVENGCKFKFEFKMRDSCNEKELAYVSPKLKCAFTGTRNIILDAYLSNSVIAVQSPVSNNVYNFVPCPFHDGTPNAYGVAVMRVIPTLTSSDVEVIMGYHTYDSFTEVHIGDLFEESYVFVYKGEICDYEKEHHQELCSIKKLQKEGNTNQIIRFDVVFEIPWGFLGVPQGNLIFQTCYGDGGLYWDDVTKVAGFQIRTEIKDDHNYMITFAHGSLCNGTAETNENLLDAVKMDKYPSKIFSQMTLTVQCDYDARRGRFQIQKEVDMKGQDACSSKMIWRSVSACPALELTEKDDCTLFYIDVDNKNVVMDLKNAKRYHNLAAISMSHHKFFLKFCQDNKIATFDRITAHDEPIPLFLSESTYYPEMKYTVFLFRGRCLEDNHRQNIAEVRLKCDESVSSLKLLDVCNV